MGLPARPIDAGAPAPEIPVRSHPDGGRPAGSRPDGGRPGGARRPQVDSRPRRVSRGAVGLAVLFFLLVVVSPLALNVGTMYGEWQMSRLEERQDDLAAEKAGLQAKAAALSSGSRVRQEAERMGMRPAPEVKYIVLADEGETEGSSGSDGAFVASTR